MNPEIICCRLPEVDGAASLSCGAALVVLLMMVLADTRSTPARAGASRARRHAFHTTLTIRHVEHQSRTIPPSPSPLAACGAP